MASSSDEGATCNNRKRKHEQHDGCSMPNTIPLDGDKDAVTIGRLKEATVHLQCSLIPSMISRKHATIVHSRLKRKWFVKDHKSCNGVYLNGKRIDPDKWVEVKVKDQLCFGTPISNNSFRYILEQLTNEDYQLVQEEVVAEEELLGGIKKKPSEMRVADTSETGAVNSEKEEPTSNTNNKDEVVDLTSVDRTRKYEMLSSMQEEFLCVICQELFVKAHSLSCSHSYCEKCIADWMKANKYCPMCRKAIEGKPVPSIAMDNAINKLVQCLPEEAQKERTELLEERSSTKKPGKDVIIISDSPVRPGTSGVVTRSASRRVHRVSSSDSDSSDLTSSESEEDEVPVHRHEGFDYGDDSSSESNDDELEGYTGLPGYSWGGYGHCYRCGDRGHWVPGCPH